MSFIFFFFVKPKTQLARVSRRVPRAFHQTRALRVSSDACLACFIRRAPCAFHQTRALRVSSDACPARFIRRVPCVFHQTRALRVSSDACPARFIRRVPCVFHQTRAPCVSSDARPACFIRRVPSVFHQTCALRVSSDARLACFIRRVPRAFHQTRALRVSGCVLWVLSLNQRPVVLKVYTKNRWNFYKAGPTKGNVFCFFKDQNLYRINFLPFQGFIISFFYGFVAGLHAELSGNKPDFDLQNGLFKML